MKNKLCILKFLPLYIGIAVLFAAYGCKKQDELCKQYVVEGGITYPGKAMNAKALTGRERVEIIWQHTDPTVTHAKIFWNNYEDSVLVDIPARTDVVKKTVDVPEGEYSFFIVTYNAKENPSIPVEVFGRSLGDNYINSLTSRGITGMSINGGILAIQWGAAEETALYSELVYTGADNAEKTIRVDSSEPVTTIDDCIFKSIRYNTVYGLETSSDVFPTDFRLVEWNEIKSWCEKEINKSTWRRYSLPSDKLDPHYDIPIFAFESAWDGDYNGLIFISHFISLPWTGAIDLGQTVSLSRLKVYHRWGFEYSTGDDLTIRKFECWGSNLANPGDDLEGGDWILLAKCGPAPQQSIEYIRANGDDFNFNVTGECNPDVAIRYIRFRVFDCWSFENPDFVGIPDMKLYGIEL